MGNLFTHFGDSKTDRLVMEHLRKIGVDPGLVLGYRIDRSPDETTLTLKLWFEDQKPESDKGE
jgi:hypothetical protein